jgi:hypothetical protein
MGMGCCSSAGKCCGNNKAGRSDPGKKEVQIDFLYLDLDVCDRCTGTWKNLEEALSDVSKVLEAAGVNVVLNKIHIRTEEEAIKHQLVTSPTIRVNGRDIQMEVKETQCDSCGSLCGEEVDCRVWVYDGVEYPVPPKAMIVDAILKEVYGSDNKEAEAKPYSLPENLKKFFQALEQKKGNCSCS